MGHAHMVVASGRFGERLETDPAYMRATASARHVIASRVALDKGLAFGTSLDIAPGRPLLEQTKFFFLGIRTTLTLVVLDMTVPTDTNQTRRTLKDSVRGCSTVDLRAVGSRAIVKLRRT